MPTVIISLYDDKSKALADRPRKAKRAWGVELGGLPPDESRDKLQKALEQCLELLRE